MDNKIELTLKDPASGNSYTTYVTRDTLDCDDEIASLVALMLLKISDDKNE